LEFASWNQELHSFASKRTLVHLAANGSNEPTAEVLILCCVRLQHGMCCIGEGFDAAIRRKKQPFAQPGAWIWQLKIKSRSFPAA